jgi:hypothetical protein
LQGREDGESETPARVQAGVLILLVDFFSSEETVPRLFYNRPDQAQAICYGPRLFDFAGEPLTRAPV